MIVKAIKWMIKVKIIVKALKAIKPWK